MKSRSLFPAMDLAACVAGFAVAAYLYGFLDPVWLLTPEVFAGLTLATTLIWLTRQLYADVYDRSVWVVSIEQTCVGAGLNLILQSLLVYTYLADPLPLPVVLAGSALAGALTGSLRAWGLGSAPAGSRILMVGCDSIGEAVILGMGRRIIGVIDRDDSRVPAGIKFLGTFDRFSEIVAAQRPNRIVLSLADWVTQIAPEVLLGLRLSGIAVSPGTGIYERHFLRVSAEGVRLADLLAPAFRPNRPIMALQAVYSNLIGLAMLVVLSPVLVILGGVSRLWAGPGPLFERVECEGFQGIQFFQLRFRVRRAGDGVRTWIGSVIARVGLVNLPQLINIVRGEMALFGPQSARHELAVRLRQLIPSYTHRFTIKPGLLGWAQTHAPKGLGIQEEVQRLEYDLYYLRECSPTLDFEILLRTMLRIPYSPRGSG